MNTPLALQDWERHEDEVESEWQEFVSAKATLSDEGVTLSVTPDDIC